MTDNQFNFLNKSLGNVNEVNVEITYYFHTKRQLYMVIRNILIIKLLLSIQVKQTQLFNMLIKINYRHLQFYLLITI